MKPYFRGRLAAAFHPRTGAVEVGDRVVMRGSPGRRGVVTAIVKSNGGKGRPFAAVLWDGSGETKEPLGRLKKEAGGNV